MSTMTAELDPTITPGDVEAAHDATPVDYNEIFEAITARQANGDAQDQLEGLGSGAGPARPGQAIVNARTLSTNGTYVGVGMCLATVRGPEFLVDALYPDAETAWAHAGKPVGSTDPAHVLRGLPIFWTNGRHGHVALSAGGGMCWTTDYRRPGCVDLAPIAALGSWCGGTFRGGFERLNEVDVWPFDAHGQPITKPKPVILDRAHKIKVLHVALDQAQHAHQKNRIAGIETWISRLEKAQAKDGQK